MVTDDDIGFELLDIPQFQKYARREFRRLYKRGKEIVADDGGDDLLMDAGDDGVFGNLATIVTYGILHATHGRIGFARLVTNAYTQAMGFGITEGVWLGELYITPKHRRCGYARRAIDLLHVTYLIVKKHNVPALKLYHSMGFRQKTPIAPLLNRSGNIEMHRVLVNAGATS